MIELPIILGQDLKEYLLEVSRHMLSNNLYHYKQDHSGMRVVSLLGSSQVTKETRYRIASAVDCECRAYLMAYPPYSINPWHVDTASQKHRGEYRKSCVTWNLMPSTAYIAPTEFEDGIHHYNDNGFILDTRKRHQMYNGQDERHLFQIAFALEPEEIKTHFLRKII
jgi:hypothetical protein